MKDFSYITNSHPSFIENLYQDFVKDPSSVDPELKKFFEGFDFAVSSGHVGANGGSKPADATAGPALKTDGGAQGTAKTDRSGPSEQAVAFKPEGAGTKPEGIDFKKELGAYRLILGYRNKGHLIAKTNPIRERKDRGANLDLGFFGLSEEDLDKT